MSDIFPVFFTATAYYIDLERFVALSHIPALLQKLFIYRVASNATISSMLDLSYAVEFLSCSNNVALL